MKVNYSEKPSLYQFDKLPGGKVLISLRENITANEKPDEDGGTLVEWTADEYSLIMLHRAGLKADVENRYADYLARAKSAESADAAAREKAELEAEIQNNLAEKLFDLDYEIMMMKEFGGAL